ncbi:type II toxin-antitoxin system RelE/ParE family toxin [Tardiphaga alba]|uniref:Type II toxin-antitoxin system RelE/ParE family toxin n=1 Tax=Tardiphaga alba TaxID=340268 RepID=A0ABX8ADG2_9BRAD|nr:type II toxin-antitoxin system RelE/ParE family toxin [Tardiphaga alba]QUS40458.1 type II toxin-antitoxin system RelE/ParE family toxin [Tardiphaga alba]
MTHDVIFLDKASNDLTSLSVYIGSQAGEAIASRYLDRLYAACMALAHFPERGTRRDDIRPNLRTIGFERRATIIFQVTDTQVQIVTIAYGGRDFETELREQE